MPGIGHASKAAFKIETGNFGTSIALNGGGEYNQVHFLSEGFNPDVQYEKSMALEGNAGYKTLYPTLKKYEGDLVIECWYRGMEALLATTLGRSHQNNSPVDEGSGAYRHCFELSDDLSTRVFDIFDMTTPSGNAVRRGTLAFEKDTSIWELASTMFNSLSFQATPERVTLTLNGAAYSLTNDSGTNNTSTNWAVPPTENQVLFTDMSIYLKARDIFTIGAPENTINIRENGSGTINITVDVGTYTGYELAQELEDKLNTNGSLVSTSYHCSYNEINRKFKVTCDDLTFRFDAGGDNFYKILGMTYPGSESYSAESTYPAIADAPVAFASGDKVGVNSIAFSVENNLKTDDQDSESGTNIVEPERNGMRNVTGTIEIPRYSNDTFIKSTNGFTTYELWINFTGATIGGGNAEELNFYFPQIKFTNVGAPISGPELIKQSLSFEAQSPLRFYNPIDFLIDDYNWKDLRAITDSALLSFGHYSDGLYAGGLGSGNANVWKLSESDWTWSSSCDTGLDDVWCLQQYGNKFFAGCDSGIILEFDGTSWSSSTDVGAGNIYDMVVYADNLYAIEDATGKIFKYNGTSWSTSCDSTLTNATRIETYNGNLYVVGDDGTNGYCLAFDGSSWSTSCDFGAGSINWMALIKHAGKLYATSILTSTPHLFEFDDSSWSDLGAVIDETTNLVSYRGNLLIFPYGSTKDILFWDFSSSSDIVINSGLDRTYGMKPREYKGRLLIPDQTTTALILDPMQEIFATNMNQNSTNLL